MHPIIGNTALIRTLVSAYRENRLTGSYLIEGPDGTGKLTIVRYLAALMNCDHKTSENEPCFKCPNCRNVLAGNHVDVHELRPEEEGKRIPVASVREFLQNTYILPSQSNWRIFIIEDSECMKKEAQNALLKSIEEPRENTVFFLLTKDKTSLLPTVRSRCVGLKTELLSRETIFDALMREGAKEDLAREAALLSGGSLGLAKQILYDGKAHEARERVLLYFRALLNADGFTKLSLILPPGGMNRKDLSVILPLMKLAIRDLTVARFADGTKPDFFTDEEFRRQLSALISPSAALRMYEMVEDLERATEGNVNLFSALSGFHLTAEKLTKSI